VGWSGGGEGGLDSKLALHGTDLQLSERWRAGTDWNRPPTQSAGMEVGESRSAQRNGTKKQPRGDG
jgi:hypothetical protein